MSDVDWRGDEVKRKVEEAQKQGLRLTISDCLATSKQLVNIRTGTLQRSIKMGRIQKVSGGFRVDWGAWQGGMDPQGGIGYAYWQEVKPIKKGGKAYLQPSADQHYPELKGNIRKSM